MQPADFFTAQMLHPFVGLNRSIGLQQFVPAVQGQLFISFHNAAQTFDFGLGRTPGFGCGNFRHTIVCFIDD